MTRSSASLDQLTSLRFFAALAVLLSHLGFLETSEAPALRWLYAHMLREGGCGVSFFFILSGFIIAHAYGDALISGRMGTGTYLFRRATRLLPLHWLMALLCLLWLAVGQGEGRPPVTILLNLLLLQSWASQPDLHYSLNGPSWSLSDELFFYALFPWLFRIRPRSLLCIMLSGLSAVTAAAFLVAVRETGYSARDEWVFYVFPMIRLLEFLTGILLFHAYRAGIGRRWAGSTAEILLALLIPAQMLLLSLADVPQSFRYQLVWVPVMAMAVLSFAHGHGILSRLLRRPLPVLLGGASFALYLTHRPLIIFASRFAGHGASADASLALVLISISVLGSVSVFLHFERPLQARLRRLPKWQPAGRLPI